VIRFTTSIRGVCVLVALAGFNFFYVGELLNPSDIDQLWIEKLGIYITTNVLAVILLGWLPRRRFRSPFLWGFLGFGALAMVIYVVVAAFNEIPLNRWITLSLNELARSITRLIPYRRFEGVVSRYHWMWMIMNLVALPLFAVVLALPQLFLATCGGLLVRRFAGRRHVLRAQGGVQPWLSETNAAGSAGSPNSTWATCLSEQDSSAGHWPRGRPRPPQS
jgi:hypothetical protein